MKNLEPTIPYLRKHLPAAEPATRARVLSKLALTLVALAGCGLVTLSARAASVTVAPRPINLFAGANFSGAYTNMQLVVNVTSVGGVPVVLSNPGAPTGVTVGFSTNSFTNDVTVTLNVAVTNVAKGIYPLTISASGGASYSTNINLIVGNLWTNANPAVANWGTVGNWTTGIPVAGDDVMFQDAGSNTNYVDSSVALSSLTFIRNISGTNQNMTLASGVTLSVVGSNGFALNVDSTNNKTTTLNIFGAGASLVVTNPVGNFTVSSDSTVATGTTLTMTNLDNFAATVSRFGLGDITLDNQGGVGAQLVRVDMAKTNVVKAGFTSDYTTTNGILYAIGLFNNGDNFNNGSAFTVNLGISNAFLADSIGMSQSRAGSSATLARFNPNIIPAGPSAYFRNTNGGRITLFAVGADAGANSAGSNAKGKWDFSNGNVDMLVDTMWLGRNRLTNTGAAQGVGNLTFNTGTVDVNTARLGYQAYTNDSFANGVVVIGGGTNSATLIVNNNLELGYTSGDFLAGSAARGNGQVTINTNGTVRAKQITVGLVSTNNTITIAGGGTLDVSNTLASAATRLNTLSMTAPGALTLHINGTNTLVYVTNLLGSGKINVASVAGIGSFPATISIISYGNPSTATLGVGTIAGGLSATINNNVANKTIDLTLSTGTPKTLIWMGYLSSDWDLTTANWLDANTSLHTNFATGDFTVFNDAATYGNITLAADVVPSQASSPAGIIITNYTLPYKFSGPGGRVLGSALLSKGGTSTLTIHGYTEALATLSSGAMDSTANGTLGSATVTASTTFSNVGAVLSSVSCAGTTVNSGTVGSLSLLASGVATNSASGTVSGALTMQTNSFLYNAGTMSGIGSTTVATNATLINAGTLSGGSLAVSGTFKDMGIGAGTSITLDSVTINGGGTFIPGGDGIGTTTLLNDGTVGHGRLSLLTGSTNVFKVDPSASPKSTKVLSTQTVLGPSQGTLQQNGGTLVINNIGTAFAAGQTFTLFAATVGGGPPNNAGPNTTNALPVMVPAEPANGLAWDLNQIIQGGVLGIFGVATNSTNIFLMTTSTSSNVVQEVSWPADHIGWQLQRQQNPPETCLSTNWATVAGSRLTNDVFITNVLSTDCIFYRLVYP